MDRAVDRLHAWRTECHLRKSLSAACRDPRRHRLRGSAVRVYGGGPDPDAPPQLLTYVLENGTPTNAMLNAVSGAFSWTPATAQAGTNAAGVTNLITISVADNGAPVLRAARSFRVVVKIPFLVGGITSAPNGDINFSVGTIVGKTYRVEYKDDFNAAMWTQLGVDQVATSTTLHVMDNIGANHQRFYRVVQVN